MQEHYTMADWTDTTPERLQIHAATQRALIKRTEAQLTAILAGIIAEVRAPQISEATLLWIAINIVESAVAADPRAAGYCSSPIQRSAR